MNEIIRLIGAFLTVFVWSIIMTGLYKQIKAKLLAKKNGIWYTCEHDLEPFVIKTPKGDRLPASSDRIDKCKKCGVFVFGYEGMRFIAVKPNDNKSTYIFIP